MFLGERSVPPKAVSLLKQSPGEKKINKTELWKLPKPSADKSEKGDVEAAHFKAQAMGPPSDSNQAGRG